MRKRIIIACLAGLAAGASAQEGNVPFDDPRWTITGGRIVDHLGQQALEGGQAVLDGVVFEDGIIEVDMAMSGQRGFAGINFRVGADGQYEHFYIRPHKSGLPDALQYTPVFHGLSSWQLYSGEGYTAAAPPTRRPVDSHETGNQGQPSPCVFGRGRDPGPGHGLAPARPVQGRHRPLRSAQGRGLLRQLCLPAG